MNDKTKEILKKLEDEVGALVSSDDWKRGLETLSQFHRYSFGNILLIASQCPHASLIAGYKKWQGLGRQVRKGERSIRIIAPSKYQKKEKDPQTGQERVVRSGLYFRCVSVFDISQTDGEDLTLPPKPQRLGEEPEDAQDILTCLQAVADDLGFHVQWVDGVIDGQEGLNGDCDFELHRIRVRRDFSSAQRIKTLCHEIAHAILHEEDHKNPDPLTRRIREVEAESTAYVVAHNLGLATDAYTIPYVASWSGGDAGLIKKTGERIAGAARTIIDGINSEEVAAV